MIRDFENVINNGVRIKKQRRSATTVFLTVLPRPLGWHRGRGYVVVCMGV